MTYLYKCRACGAAQEREFKMGQAPKTVQCVINCGPAHRVWTPAPAIFKWRKP